MNFKIYRDELLLKKSKKLSELVSEIPVYQSTPEIRIECTSDDEKRRITKK